jgi:uncharacterized protein (TIGR00288 family)
MMEQSRSQVALLIDADNSTYVLIPFLLAEAEKFGDISLRRVYGNWDMSYYHLEQRYHKQTSPGKNATDIALVIDAMDILYSGVIDHFCLVTSDSDYTPLVLRLRSAGCKVLGIGKPTTPFALKTACTAFVSTDQLLSKPAPPSATPMSVINMSVSTASPTRAPTRSVCTESLTLLVKAYEDVAQKEKREWVLLSSIGTVLKLFGAPFSPAVYGHKNLLTFVKAYPDHFETRRQASKGKPVLVRRRRNPSPEQAILLPSSARATTPPNPEDMNNQ